MRKEARESAGAAALCWIALLGATLDDSTDSAVSETARVIAGASLLAEAANDLSMIRKILQHVTKARG